MIPKAFKHGMAVQGATQVMKSFIPSLILHQVGFPQLKFSKNSPTN